MTTLTDEACELSEFVANTREHLTELARTGRVELLTIDGEVKGVVMAPHVFDRLVEQVERAEITAALRRGLADLAAGRVKPSEQVYRDVVASAGLDASLLDDLSLPDDASADEE